MSTAEKRNDICPLCGGENSCQRVAQGLSGDQRCEPPCWCYSRSFPPELYDQLPGEEKGRRCICQHCLQKFIGNSL